MSAPATRSRPRSSQAVAPVRELPTAWAGQERLVVPVQRVVSLRVRAWRIAARATALAVSLTA